MKQNIDEMIISLCLIKTEWNKSMLEIFRNQINQEVLLTVTNPCFSLNLMILSMIGIPKARVFPVPVLARPIMSRPRMAGSSTALCLTQTVEKELCHY